MKPLEVFHLYFILPPSLPLSSSCLFYFGFVEVP